MTKPARLTLVLVVIAASTALLAGVLFFRSLSQPKQVLGLQACSDFTYSEWSACFNGVETRQVMAASPLNCDGGHPEVQRACTICTEFNYSEWSACTDGRRIRSVAEGKPKGCIGGIPHLSESCVAGELLPLNLMSGEDNTILTSDDSALEAFKQSGYQLESRLGYIYSQPSDKTFTLESMHDKSGHIRYVATDVEKASRTAQGYTTNAIIGYILRSPQADTIPLYRLSSSADKSSFFASQESEKNRLLRLGYQLDGIIGYIQKP